MEAEYKPNENYLHIIVSGKLVKNIPENITPELIKKKCIKNGLKKILINGLNLTGHYKSIVRFNLAKEFAKFFTGSNIQIAVVTNKKIAFYNPIFEIAALNRGVYIKIFTDLSKAENWLLN